MAPGVGARVPRHRAGPALRQPVHAHLPGRPLDHARAGARGARLGDRGGERPVHPLVAGKDVLGEEAAPPGLRGPGRERPHAGQWPALPAAVPAVAPAAHPVGPGVRGLARDALREPPQQPPHVNRAVLEPRHGRAAQGRRGRRA